MFVQSFYSELGFIYDTCTSEHDIVFKRPRNYVVVRQNKFAMRRLCRYNLWHSMGLSNRGKSSHSNQFSYSLLRVFAVGKNLMWPSCTHPQLNIVMFQDKGLLHDMMLAFNT